LILDFRFGTHPERRFSSQAQKPKPKGQRPKPKGRVKKASLVFEARW
jgi:hypothetical protein